MIEKKTNDQWVIHKNKRTKCKKTWTRPSLDLMPISRISLPQAFPLLDLFLVVLHNIHCSAGEYPSAECPWTNKLNIQRIEFYSWTVPLNLEKYLSFKTLFANNSFNFIIYFKYKIFYENIIRKKKPLKSVKNYYSFKAQDISRELFL